MMPLAALADDLTGSCDCGAQFSARGARVLVLTEFGEALPGEARHLATGKRVAPPRDTPWDVVVLNTDSRHLPPAHAARRVREGAQRLAAAGFPLRYKKIDSTLRGPLAAECEALLAGGANLLLAPAYPAAGRTVREGVLRVQGQPVHETEFGRDRHNPVRESHLPTLLGALGGPQTTLGLQDPASAKAVAHRLRATLAGGARVVVADAETDAHLDALATALWPTWEDGHNDAADDGGAWVAVGSAGLAAALALRLTPVAARPAEPPRFPRAGPVLVLAGSRTAVTEGQVRLLASEPGVRHLQIDPALTDAADWEASLPRWARAQATALLDGVPQAGVDEGAQVLLVSIERGGEAAAADLANPTDPGRYQQRSAFINAAFGALAAQLAACPLAGLVLTGGDIARAVLQALGATALQLGPQVLPGIPLGWPVAGAQTGLPMVTKAGGFGAPDALAQAVRFLRHGARGTHGAHGS